MSGWFTLANTVRLEVFLVMDLPCFELRRPKLFEAPDPTPGISKDPTSEDPG
jgi:hypothetical protein